MAALLLLLLCLLLLLRSSSGATTSDRLALAEFARRINLPEGTWDTSTNPCSSGKWPGVCCSDSPVSCCLNKKFNPSDTSCISSTQENATISAVNLDSNYRPRAQLNGFISDSICNVTSLLQLDLNNNNLTGSIPSCIGDKLTQLFILGLAGGNLNGEIPSQLGKLTQLQEIYLDNNNLSGQIPSTFGSLSSLKQLYLRGNQLSGPIPSSLGALASLTSLHLQVNQLNGSIPASLVNLKNVTECNLFSNRLSGELNVTVFQGMAALTTLDLHGNAFTGSVPALGRELTALKKVNLGFNRLSGTIPASFGALAAVTEIYLGHNNISGSLPSTLTNLTNIQVLDISHNQLTGSLQNLPVSPALDFSFNAFDMATVPSRFLQQGRQLSYFNCISQGSSSSSSCQRSQSGMLSSFAFARNGPIANSDGTSFESDATLNSTGGFSYFGRDLNWALEVSGSSAGTFRTQTRIQDIPNGDNLALYQALRWSSNYMAYHGGSLENGRYIVTMYFAETLIPFVNMRIFDVLLQGTVVEKDMDVVRRVGAYRACKVQHNVNVTNGTLSIEFIYRGKDRYLDPAQFNNVGSSGPMVSAISVKSLQRSPGSKSSWRAVTIATVVSFVVVVVVVLIWRRRSRRSQFRSETWSHGKCLGLRAYTYKELSDATEGFSSERKLGEGAFGKVYLGTVDGNSVAVKQLMVRTQQSKEAFRKEVEILSGVQHKNLLSVRGYCVDAEFPMLVCDYMHNGSLDKLLYSGHLTWEQRKNIAIGTALGLAYLHDESKDKIVHCDVKPPNILLDEDLNPRIGDFGMARLYEEGRSHITATKMGGTVGYLAPEYAMHYQLSEKADVYSFGVVLLELISGRRAIEVGVQQGVLVEWAQSLASLGTSQLMALVDPRFEEDDFPLKELVNVASIALHCIQDSASARPGMRNVWLMLTDMADVPPLQVSVLRMDTLKALINSYATTMFSASGESVPFRPR